MLDSRKEPIRSNSEIASSLGAKLIPRMRLKSLMKFILGSFEVRLILRQGSPSQGRTQSWRFLLQVDPKIYFVEEKLSDSEPSLFGKDPLPKESRLNSHWVPKKELSINSLSSESKGKKQRLQRFRDKSTRLETNWVLMLTNLIYFDSLASGRLQSQNLLSFDSLVWLSFSLFPRELISWNSRISNKLRFLEPGFITSRSKESSRGMPPKSLLESGNLTSRTSVAGKNTRVCLHPVALLLARQLGVGDEVLVVSTLATKGTGELMIPWLERRIG